MLKDDNYSDENTSQRYRYIAKTGLTMRFSGGIGKASLLKRIVEKNNIMDESDRENAGRFAGLIS